MPLLFSLEMGDESGQGVIFVFECLEPTIQRPEREDIADDPWVSKSVQGKADSPVEWVVIVKDVEVVVIAFR